MAGQVNFTDFTHEIRVSGTIDTLSELSPDTKSSNTHSKVAYTGTLDQELWGRILSITGNETFELNALENADGSVQDFTGSKVRFLFINWSDDATGKSELKFDGPWGNEFADVEVQPGQTSTVAFPGLDALTVVGMHEIKFEPIGGATGDLTIILGVSL